VEGGFRNPNPDYRRADAWTRWSFLSRRVWQSIVSPRTFTAPRAVASRRGPVSSQGAVVTWVGHATVLVELDGVSVLTDPQWSDRASPLSWMGPRRLSPPGIPFEDLPPIDVVLISHDHYDHLDLPTVRRLAQAHGPLFLVPLGLKAWFEANGIARVEELDWWQSREHRGLRFVCTPTQHFAQRSLWDQNRRLWGSWAVVGRERRFYFSGDTGYFAGFKEIGERLGPFDLAAMAIGAYLPRRMMLPHHVSP
jgi:L-ascorbate metabolism protein UlaG (beta-lactamase superfamily)